MKVNAPVVSTAVAMLAGLAVLFLRLFPAGLDSIYTRLLQGAAALAAVALIVGIFNLLKVHFGKLAEGGAPAVYSGALILSLMATFILAFVLGPNGSLGELQPTNWLFQYVVVPVETSLVALLAVSLIYAAARLLRRSPNTFSIVFLVAALLVLLGGSLLATGSFGLFSELLAGLRNWIAQVPAAAGARGLLLGVALGAVAAGLRILIGADRPFGG